MMRQEALKVPSFSEDLRIQTTPPSEGVGVDAVGAIARLVAMRRLLTGAGQKISAVQNVAAKSDTIEGQLAEKLAAFKRVAASVGMHLDPDWRSRLFAKLDSLIDPEEWDRDFALPSEQSFSTFLRMIIYLHPTKRPGLGLSAKGHFLASWSKFEDRIEWVAGGGEQQSIHPAFATMFGTARTVDWSADGAPVTQKGTAGAFNLSRVTAAPARSSAR